MLNEMTKGEHSYYYIKTQWIEQLVILIYNLIFENMNCLKQETQRCDFKQRKKDNYVWEDERAKPRNIIAEERSF